MLWPEIRSPRCRRFDATVTSKRLLMFQAAFLRHTAAPADALATYAARFGQPTEAAQSALLNAARSILKVQPARTPLETVRTLFQTVLTLSYCAQRLFHSERPF